MKILQVVPTYLPAVRHGGPIRSVHGLARALVARGQDVTVYTTHLHGRGVLQVPTDRTVDLDGVAVRYFPVSTPRRLARSPAMGAALNAGIGGFDIVHLQSIFLWPTASAARAAERAGVPWVVSPRGMLVRELFRRRGWLRKRVWLAASERRTLERARRIVATSELEATEAAAFHLRLPPIEVLPNGVDPLSPAPLEALPAEWRGFLAEGVPFLFLGRLSWKKGLDRLVQSLTEVPQARLVLAGSDDEGIGDGLDRLAAECGVAGRVLRTGWVEGEIKAALVGAARALVLPSISENFGNVVLEAWSLGVPVVVGRGVGLADEVAANNAGLVVADEPVVLAAALRRLAENAEAAREMGKRGRSAAERYSWPAIAARAEAIYAEVVAERGGKR